MRNRWQSVASWWRRNTQSQLVPRVFGRPDEVWHGYPIWIHVEMISGEGESLPTAATAEIGVISPARLLVRRRSRFHFGVGDLPRVDVSAVRGTFDVWSDDIEFAHRLFADPVIVETLPLALKSTEQVEISPNTVKVQRRVIDLAVPDAVAAAKALAIAIVSALNLPRMVL